MTRVYKCFILPHLEYCSSILVGIGKTEANKLEDANYYILRTILNVSKGRSYESLLQQAKIKSLANRRYFQSLVLLFKCMKDHGPQYIQHILN